MAREADAYGLTIQSFSVGISLVVQVTMAPNVLLRDIMTSTGGTLLLGGVTAAAGYFAMPPAYFPYRVPGPAPLFLSAGGQTVTTQLITYLSQGIGSTQFP
jgi:hypothetical protein